MKMIKHWHWQNLRERGAPTHGRAWAELKLGPTLRAEWVLLSKRCGVWKPEKVAAE